MPNVLQNRRVVLANPPRTAAPASNWILATGVWRDEGVWDDAETWNDS